MFKKSSLPAWCGLCCLVVCSVAAVPALTQESRPAATRPASTRPADAKLIALPKPVTEGGKPLMEVLKNRQTSREFDSTKLTDRVLSNLLWAACGINRPETGKRTAPTANNRQEIDVYLATAEGLFLYEPKEHALRPIVSGDIRALTGTQQFVKDAPLNLIFVADYAKMGAGAEDSKRWVAGADTGFVSQNIYLFCASEGLATVVRGMVDRPALSKAMNLRADQWIVLAQTVGYPKK